jgi:hypothetical protein
MVSLENRTSHAQVNEPAYYHHVIYKLPAISPIDSLRATSALLNPPSCSSFNTNYLPGNQYKPQISFFSLNHAPGTQALPSSSIVLRGVTDRHGVSIISIKYMQLINSP